MLRSSSDADASAWKSICSNGARKRCFASGESRSSSATKPLFVCNDTTFEIAYDKVAGSLRSAGVEPKVLKYNGFCCREIALDHARAGAIDGIDLVIGCGGGVVIDFSKCLADIAGVPLVTMPTSSATCCAFTPIAPCYTPEGRYISTSFFRREVAAALLDLTILSRQPARLLVAGACDAMAKKVEMEFWNTLPGAVDNPVAAGIASLVADYIYVDLDRKLDAAVEDLRAGEPTQTLRDVVFSWSRASPAARGRRPSRTGSTSSRASASRPRR